MTLLLAALLIYFLVAGYLAQVWVGREFGSTCTRNDLVFAYVLGWLWLPIHGLYHLAGWRT